ncbi:MAG: hypothetical protein LWX09_09595 [Bacteroidia bacterium]|jgi:hypothetical protein|nr:hypothetical protein [Bacteroidia bacterium]
MKGRLTLVVIFTLFGAGVLNAAVTKDHRLEDLSLKGFITLYHQHHDFFGKAFSFQGIEGGGLVNQRFYLGAYTSFFASNLKAEINGVQRYVWIGQAGVLSGYLLKGERRIDPGFQINIGYFTLRLDEERFGLFQLNRADGSEKGLVVAPQLFGELGLKTWLKLRAGLSYNFYFPGDQSVINQSDLNRLSFTFGIVFIPSR